MYNFSIFEENSILQIYIKISLTLKFCFNDENIFKLWTLLVELHFICILQNRL